MQFANNANCLATNNNNKNIKQKITTTYKTVNIGTNAAKDYRDTRCFFLIGILPQESPYQM
jgi:hypothetical protein